MKYAQLKASVAEAERKLAFAERALERERSLRSEEVAGIPKGRVSEVRLQKLVHEMSYFCRDRARVDESVMEEVARELMRFAIREGLITVRKRVEPADPQVIAHVFSFRVVKP